MNVQLMHSLEEKLGEERREPVHLLEGIFIKNTTFLAAVNMMANILTGGGCSSDSKHVMMALNIRRIASESVSGDSSSIINPPKRTMKRRKRSSDKFVFVSILVCLASQERGSALAFTSPISTSSSRNHHR
eukprot:scaffold128_cov174-Skeletonema_marinoi.AAC.10